MIVTERAYPHSWTPVPLSQCWQHFADACEGGGTPPDWTQASDVRVSVPPPDAAGTLWRLGDTPEIPETIATAAVWLEDVIDVPCTPLGAYFSSGGRGVFLLVAGRCGYVLVARPERTPRLGASESGLEQFGPVLFDAE